MVHQSSAMHSTSEIVGEICVIGGSGFIGTRLCETLEESGVSFYIVDKVTSRRFPSLTRIADVRNPAALSLAIPNRPEAIILLAAEHRDDVTPRSLYDEVNVEGARNVCELAAARGIEQIVFASSVAVYGFAPIDTDETGTLRPFNDYGRTKAEAEAVLNAWYANSPHDRALTIVRPTVVFGERNRGNVYNLLKQVASRRFVMIGSGLNRKSMAYVGNVADFFKFVIRFKSGRLVVNYIDKPDFTMHSLISFTKECLGHHSHIGWSLPRWLGELIGAGLDVVANIFKIKFPVSRVRVQKFCSDTAFSSGAAKLGFTAPTPLPEALRRTVSFEFLENHSDEPIYHSE